MASFKIYYNPKNAKKDGRFMIYIKVVHNGKQAYLNTGITSEVSQLDRAGNLNQKIHKAVYKFLLDVEDRYLDFAPLAGSWDVKTLVSKLSDTESARKRYDFYAFVQQIVDELLLAGRKGTAATIAGFLSTAKRYRDELYIDEITIERIKDFERYMGEGRTIMVDSGRCKFEKQQKPLSHNTIIAKMGFFKQMYYEFMRRHDEVVVKNPWIKYKPARIKDVAPRNLPVDVLRKIISYDGYMRYPIARDLFLLSLYFCGINLKDLYTNARVVKGRLEYNRSKTRDHRSDDAFSSILVQPEAQWLVDKYTKDGRFVFADIYSNMHNYDNVLRLGLDELAEALELDQKLIYYNARHSIATIMSNDLEIPDSHIKMVLNHVNNLGVTNRYIQKDFSKIDRANRRFLDYLFADEYEDLI